MVTRITAALFLHKFMIPWRDRTRAFYPDEGSLEYVGRVLITCVLAGRVSPGHRGNTSFHSPHHDFLSVCDLAPCTFGGYRKHIHTSKIPSDISKISKENLQFPQD